MHFTALWMWNDLLSELKENNTKNALHNPACILPFRLQNSGISGPKFKSNFCQKSSTVLTRTSILRSFYPLWNASAQNEGEVRRFTPIVAKIGYTLSDREKKVCTYRKDSAKISPGRL